MLLLEAALTLRITVSEIEVEEYLKEFKDKYQIATDEEFQRQLNREGMTLVAFREQSERNLKTEKLVMGRIVPRLQIRDSEIQKFFEENRDQLSTKADKVHLRHIFIAFKPSQADRDAAYENVKKALNEIETGDVTFEDVAKRYDTSKQAGDLINASTEELSQFPKIFQESLTNLSIGTRSEPVEGDRGLYVFTVENKTDEMLEFRYFIVPLVPSPSAVQEIHKRADEVYAKLEAGEDFSKLCIGTFG